MAMNDNELGISFGAGGLGDLPDDVIGPVTTRHAMADAGGPLADKRLVDIWSQRVDGRPELLHNRAADEAPPSSMAGYRTACEPEGRVIRHATEQRRLADEHGLEAIAFVKASWYPDCITATRVCKDRRVPNAPCIVADAPRCDQCTGDHCEATGKRIVRAIDDDAVFINECKAGLIRSHTIDPNAQVSNLADLQQAVSGVKPASQGGPRMYTGAPPAGEKVRPVSGRDITAMLAQVAQQRATEQAEFDEAAEAREIGPACRAIVEALLKRSPMDMIKRDLGSRFAGDLLPRAWKRVVRELDPHIIVAYRVALPAFSGCTKQHGSPRPAYLKAIPRCAECLNSKDAAGKFSGSCRAYQAPFLPQRVSADHAAAAIDDLAGEALLTRSQVDRLKATAKTNPRSAIRQAATMALSATPCERTVSPTPRTAAAAHQYNDNDLEAAVGPVGWVRDQLTRGTPLPTICAAVDKHGVGTDSRALVEAVMSDTVLVHAAAIPDCRDRRRVAVDKAELVKASKCGDGTCPHSSGVGCVRLNRIFSEASSVSAQGQVPTTSDGWYAQQVGAMSRELDTAPNPANVESLLDIEFPSGGEDMPVDVGDKVERSITLDQRLFAGAELVVDIEPDRKPPPVEIEFGPGPDFSSVLA
jgi:hypothetical protein